MTAMTFSRRWTHAVGGAFALSTLVFATACNTAPQTTPAVGSAGHSGRGELRAASTDAGSSGRRERRDGLAGRVRGRGECARVVSGAAARRTRRHRWRISAPHRVRSRSRSTAISGDAQVVPVSTTAVRPVRTNQVVYDERPVRKRPRLDAASVGARRGAVRAHDQRDPLARSPGLQRLGARLRGADRPLPAPGAARGIQGRLRGHRARRGVRPLADRGDRGAARRRLPFERREVVRDLG